jgi:hypothetical protein
MVEASWIQAPTLGGALGIYPKGPSKSLAGIVQSTHDQACETIHEDPSRATPPSPLLYGKWMDGSQNNGRLELCSSATEVGGALTLNTRWKGFTIYNMLRKLSSQAQVGEHNLPTWASITRHVLSTEEFIWMFTLRIGSRSGYRILPLFFSLSFSSLLLLDLHSHRSCEKSHIFGVRINCDTATHFGWKRRTLPRATFGMAWRS